MSLTKRIAFAVFIVLAVSGAVWAYLGLKESKRPQVDAISVIPDSCLVYMNTPDLFDLNKKLNEQNLLVDKLKLFKDVDKFCGMLQAIDSLLNSSETLHNEMEKNLVHFALYKNMNWLIAFNIKQLGDQKQVASEFTDVFHARKIEDDVYAFKLNTQKYIYFKLNSGIVVVSDSRETIDQALKKATPHLKDSKPFQEFKSTLEENSSLAIYTNHRLYGESKMASRLDLSAVFKKGYSAGMVDLQPSQIAVNGFADCDDTEIISLLSKQEAQSTEFLDQIPSGATSFTAYGFSSFTELQKKKNKFFKANTSQFWKRASDSALYNLELDFNENVATCLVDFETDFPKQHFVIMNVNDTVKAREHLRLMSDSLVSDYPVPVYRLENSGQTVLFAPLSKNTVRYAALYNGYLFFSETSGGLSGILRDLKNGALLSENKSFASYQSQNFPETFNYLIYAAPNLSKESMNGFFKFETDSTVDPYKNIRHFSFCVTNQADHFKFRWHLLNEAETMNKYPNVLWSVTLEDSAFMKMTPFVNHITHENELIVQDDKNKLYLVNAKGNVLWKKVLNERIQSPIFTVDIFKNNKYQILFNTKNYLHLIDRNGNYVKGYPVKLPAEASAALSLFDYDKDKDYRLFVPCKNKNIYNYSLSGLKQDGFTTVKTENEVELPVQYVKVGPSDYLVAVDDEGKIYTFSRKGVGRIGLTNRTVEHCSAFYVDATNNINSTFLIYADDRNSLINKISFSDRKEIIKLNSEMDNARIGFALVDENRTMDILFTKPNAVAAYDLNGNLLLEKNVGNDLSQAEFYSDESHNVVYGWSLLNHDITIINQVDNKTQNYKGTSLPLIFDLFNDSKKYLIITNGKRLNCLLLN